MTALATLLPDPAAATAAELVDAVRRAASVDLDAFWRALTAIPPDQMITDAADLAGVLAPVCPELATVKAVLLVFAWIAHGYETGAIRSADPDTAAMARAAGPDTPAI